MGESRGKKRPRGKVDSALTAHHIGGEPNQCLSEWLMTTHMEPESNPVNALSPMRAPLLPTARARTASEWAVLKAEPPSTQLPPRVSPLAGCYDLDPIFHFPHD